MDSFEDRFLKRFLRIPVRERITSYSRGGHSEYTGWGNREAKGDYWDCYCLPKRGQLPPNHFPNLLKWVDNPEEVKRWKEKYEFDMIICHCSCCHGAIPMLVYGWLDGDKIGTRRLDDFKKGGWTAGRSFHGFYVNGDRLTYFGEKSYS
jgi:hypothetical protein